MLIKTLRRMKSTSLISEFKDSYVKFGYADGNSMLKAIGTGILTVRDIFNKLRPKEDKINIDAMRPSKVCMIFVEKLFWMELKIY